MLRPTTALSQQRALGNIQQSQARVQAYADQVGTGRLGNDLKSFAADAETLIATRSLQVRNGAYIKNAQALKVQLEMQDQALGKLTRGAKEAVAAVTKALANNDGGALMLQLQSALDQAAGGLNGSYAGTYLFAGGLSSPPLQITQLADLDAPPPPPPAPPPPRPEAFANGALRRTSRLDDQTTVATGFLASDIGAPLLDALADVAAFPDTSFGAPLSADQHDFLRDLLKKLTHAEAHANNAQATNGSVQSQVSTTIEGLLERKDSLQTLIAGVTEADPMEAAARLQAAQAALQASTKAFTILQESSLLKLLTR